MTGRTRADGEVCSGAAETCLLSATRLRFDAIHFGHSSAQVCLDPLSQSRRGHVAVGAVTADPQVRCPRGWIEAHKLHCKRINPDQGPHSMERGSNAILNLVNGATASTAEGAHTRKLKGRA